MTPPRPNYDHDKQPLATSFQENHSGHFLSRFNAGGESGSPVRTSLHPVAGEEEKQAISPRQDDAPREKETGEEGHEDESPPPLSMVFVHTSGTPQKTDGATLLNASCAPAPTGWCSSLSSLKKEETLAVTSSMVAENKSTSPASAGKQSAFDSRPNVAFSLQPRRPITLCSPSPGGSGVATRGRKRRASAVSSSVLARGKQSHYFDDSNLIGCLRGLSIQSSSLQEPGNPDCESYPRKKSIGYGEQRQGGQGTLSGFSSSLASRPPHYFCRPSNNAAVPSVLGGAPSGSSDPKTKPVLSVASPRIAPVRVLTQERSAPFATSQKGLRGLEPQVNTARREDVSHLLFSLDGRDDTNMLKNNRGAASEKEVDHRYFLQADHAATSSTVEEKNSMRPPMAASSSASVYLASPRFSCSPLTNTTGSVSHSRRNVPFSPSSPGMFLSPRIRHSRSSPRTPLPRVTLTPRSSSSPCSLLSSAVSAHQQADQETCWMLPWQADNRIMIPGGHDIIAPGTSSGLINKNNASPPPAITRTCSHQSPPADQRQQEREKRHSAQAATAMETAVSSPPASSSCRLSSPYDCPPPLVGRGVVVPSRSGTTAAAPAAVLSQQQEAQHCPSNSPRAQSRTRSRSLWTFAVQESDSSEDNLLFSRFEMDTSDDYSLGSLSDNSSDADFMILVAPGILAQEKQASHEERQRKRRSIGGHHQEEFEGADNHATSKKVAARPGIPSFTTTLKKEAEERGGRPHDKTDDLLAHRGDLLVSTPSPSSPPPSNEKAPECPPAPPPPLASFASTPAQLSAVFKQPFLSIPDVMKLSIQESPQTPSHLHLLPF